MLLRGNLLDHRSGQTCSCLVISKTEPGKYSDWENKRSVQLKLDGIQWSGWKKVLSSIIGPNPDTARFKYPIRAFNTAIPNTALWVNSW